MSIQYSTKTRIIQGGTTNGLRDNEYVQYLPIVGLFVGFIDFVPAEGHPVVVPLSENPVTPDPVGRPLGSGDGDTEGSPVGGCSWSSESWERVPELLKDSCVKDGGSTATLPNTGEGINVLVTVETIVLFICQGCYLQVVRIR